MPTSKYGLLIGQFAPLSQKTLQFINILLGQVDELHLIALTCHTATAQDIARWLQVSYQGLDFIKIHTLASLNLQTADLEQICQLNNIQLFN